ncbi:MAG: DUF6273 domain-containing protein, partial [Lachnospiraceae bacterium]|nr:DUF6273 domain-containing protein [Lachnospiraceae bacterium]
MKNGRIVALSLATVLVFTNPLEVMAEKAAGDDDYSLPAVSDNEIVIQDPIKTSSGDTTWDCIWFGNYWQEDTNEDGYCLDKDITVSENGGRYFDQYGKELEDFTGEIGKTYYADEKMPVKWRVLDIDDKGMALLLSDRVLDIVEYNKDGDESFWKDSDIRQFLNCFDLSGKAPDASPDLDGFLNNAFSGDEIKAISLSEVRNVKSTDPPYIPNPVYPDRNGGEDTLDRVFCLSVTEALDPDYGFWSNDFVLPKVGGQLILKKPYLTEADPAREALNTAYVRDKYLRGYMPESGDAAVSDAWWLRTHGS